MKQPAADFRAETMALAEVLAPLEAESYTAATQFKSWTINDVLVHLHFWNRAADLSLTDPEGFAALLGRLLPAVQSGGLRPFENAEIPERGPELRALWLEHACDMAARWADEDPKRRVPWAGPSMSLRSSITARQMETWAHGFEVFDHLGQTRRERDRLRNIVVLGVNTFGWSHKVRGLPTPEDIPHLMLTAPSGALWEHGGANGSICGPAADFAAVVTQTRALADTALVIEGADAQRWMETAQCFAGPPETPPAPGSRTRQET